MKTNQKIRSRRRRRKCSNRRGTAAAECAFCIPLLLLLTFATLEICSAIFVKETLTVACYEGARVGVKRNATADNVRLTCEDVLDARGVVDYTITVTPDEFEPLDALDPIRVNVSIPTARNSFFVGQFFAGKEISSTVVMVREFDD